MARPKSDVKALKVFQVNIRLTLDEQIFIESQANTYGISVVQYVRRRSLNKQLPKHAISPLNREFLVELSRIGNNINQLTKKSNQNAIDRNGLDIELNLLKEMLYQIKSKILE